MDNKDTIAIDGGYTLFVEQFIDKSSEKGYEFSHDNFVYPIRKNPGESLSISEDHFNKTFGSFRIACLLKNIQKFTELFNVPVLPHHKLWESENFEFPVEKRLLDIVVNEYSDIEDNIENNNSSSCDDLPKTNEKSKKRKVKNKGKQKAYKSYEIEAIVNHKLENNIYQFLVKWKDYPESDNSWLAIDSFNEKSMLKEYIDNNNIGIL
ncbi:hypothetical protein RO3G_05327 [Rhizopus delemar RA 99-880]|uniref:Chromo domain-containing protein n=1 Tax=Rhizopus delemar (strain RA 99-880 / ATCC MYA-4621 / FGSC 9543 / NRRL 43880) TaxID=246409 RepID=I1BWP2_RHIO9|nr:hypothetical protein RO3G_05327 [Rhizopus delemar RA 99-880]|eukprot:EIE80622.1 hypothetical protein RO3G_05327 [Rhizopus delemar RA 99-880]